MVGTKVAYDQILAVLLTYASLFSDDGNSENLSASEKQVIGKMQKTSVRRIKRYLYASYPPSVASVKLMAAMETLVSLRETSDMIKEIG